MSRKKRKGNFVRGKARGKKKKDEQGENRTGSEENVSM